MPDKIRPDSGEAFPGTIWRSDLGISHCLESDSKQVALCGRVFGILAEHPIEEKPRRCCGACAITLLG